MMSKIDCPLCETEIMVAPGSEETELTVTCRSCGARLRILAEPDPSGLGAATIFQPQLLSEGGAETAIVDGSRLASGTLRLNPEEMRQISGPLKLKLEAYLVVVGDPAGRRHSVVGQRATVGREGADINVEDPTLSSRHFEIEVRGEEFFLRDLESSNGTLLNGSPIRSAELAAGDKIRAGRTTFLFQTHEVIPTGGSRPPERR